MHFRPNMIQYIGFTIFFFTFDIAADNIIAPAKHGKVSATTTQCVPFQPGRAFCMWTHEEQTLLWLRFPIHPLYSAWVRAGSLRLQSQQRCPDFLIHAHFPKFYQDIPKPANRWSLQDVLHLPWGLLSVEHAWNTSQRRRAGGIWNRRPSHMEDQRSFPSSSWVTELLTQPMSPIPYAVVQSWSLKKV